MSNLRIKSVTRIFLSLSKQIKNVLRDTMGFSEYNVLILIIFENKIQKSEHRNLSGF